ncbi:hypothetical protein Tco_0610533, partial [Tanacetum coccineum]
MGYFQIIRADGSSRRYSSLIKMLQNIDREDLETLCKLVKAKHGSSRPEEAYERVLWGDLKINFVSLLLVPFAVLFEGGLEAQQLDHVMGLIESTLLSNSEDRWDWDLNGDGVFRVKDVRNLLDETFLPKADWQ